jgi:hypothetical protein
MRWWLLLLVATACARPPARPVTTDVGNGALARWSRGERPRALNEDHDDGGCMDEECLEESALDDVDLDPAISDDDGLTDPPPDPADDYTASSVLSGGSVGGRVIWSRPPRRDPAQPATAGCDAVGPGPFVGRDGSVAGAVVYLEEVVIGKPPQAVGGVLAYRRCQLTPRVQIAAPIGALLLLANEGSGATQLELDHMETQTRTTLAFSDGRYLEVPLGVAGTYRLRSDRRWPGGQTAWIVVPRHPYFVVTGEDGQFLLGDVPAGAYELVVWHPPPDDGLDGKPVIKRHLVRVHRARATTLTIDLGRP